MNKPVASMLIAILIGGFLAGSIDVGAAALIYHVSPVIILHAIASGLLGKPAFQDGASIALLGLILQWLMSWLIAGVYVFAAQRLTWMKRRWLAAGLTYGVVIYAVMNYVVRPLSAAWPPSNFQFHAVKFFENLAAMLVFGLIVSGIARLVTRPLAPSGVTEPANRDSP
ncbi:MAG: hypothetical protein ACREJM_10020 [Candidatus Saccharimonadales bacterium]